MSKSILDNLFGSRVRVKLLKLFYRQHPAPLTVSELVVRVQEPAFIVRRELALLQQLKMLKKNRRPKTNIDQYALNEEFDFFPELRELLLKPSPAETGRLAKRINALGRMKLAVVAGIFVSQPDDTTYEAPVDLFIVGDDVERGKLTKFLKTLESEMGTEIRFGLMDTDEFKYRYEMFDRFLRVLLEGPHRKILNKLEM